MLLAAPVNGASLATFRVAVGLIMALEAYSLGQPNPAAIGMGTSPLETYYTGSNIQFHFPYAGFDWLPLLPAPWIYALVALQALAGITMAVGFYYRASAITVFLSWAYLFLVESTRTYWQSHYYLELLVTFLMLWMPAARKYSVDAWLARGQGVDSTVPFWTLVLLRGQLVIAYFYAGVAKINADWLLDAVPVRWYLTEEHVLAPWAGLLSSAQLELLKGVVHSVTFAYFICHVGLVFDLAVGFLFLIRRTRILALVLMVTFHATNHLLIFDNIGWFPILGIATATIFLDADWPERCWRWLRRPRLTKPDWRWFGIGALLVPVVGATLGWKLKPTSEAATPQPKSPVGNSVALGVVLWLVFQTLLPVRHYLIPGDGRVTYEGLSFSWRLKADMHHALSVQMFVKDTALIARDESGRNRIDWNAWHGAKEVYRKIIPGSVPWHLLPEIMIVIEPVLGERIVFNPLAGGRTIGEQEARERVKRIWQELYGRQPRSVHGAAPLSQALDSIAAGLRAGGHFLEATNLTALSPRTKQTEQAGADPAGARQVLAEVRAALIKMHGREADEALKSLLRPIAPFALEGERPLALPFLLIDDPGLFQDSSETWSRVDRAKWKIPPGTRAHRGPQDFYVGGEPLVIYTGNVGPQARDMLPLAVIFDAQANPERLPYVWWNSLKDLPPSKLNHVSNQAFYLRRYARRVAGLWENDYGRRPVVQATTALSFNGRPYQSLVDPAADLASVETVWFGHNSWIRDLETLRIPRDALRRGGDAADRKGAEAGQ